MNELQIIQSKIFELRGQRVMLASVLRSNVAIGTALAKLQLKEPSQKKRRPIGLVQYDNDKEK